MRILELDNISALFVVVSAIAANGGNEIVIGEHGNLGDGLPRLPQGVLGPLRLNGWLVTEQVGSGVVSASAHEHARSRSNGRSRCPVRPSMATRAAERVSVRCPECGEGRTISGRQARRLGDGGASRCHLCRASVQIRVGPAERAWA